MSAREGRVVGVGDRSKRIFDKIYEKKLISIVEMYPIFYDKTLPQYRDQPLVRRTWDIVATLLNEFSLSITPDSPKVFDGMMCKDQWIGLRNRYTKERSRIKKLGSGSAFEQSKAYFSFFEEMKFIDQFVCIRKKNVTTSSGTTSSNDNDKDNNNDYDNDSDNVDDPSAVTHSQSLIDPETGVIIETREVQVLGPPAKKMKKREETDPETSAILKVLDKLNTVMDTDTPTTSSCDPELKTFSELVYHELAAIPKEIRVKYNFKLAILNFIDSLKAEYCPL